MGTARGPKDQTGPTARQRRYRRRAQLRTVDAQSYAKPWTPDDDQELLDGDGTVLERAVRLGRTYLAAVRRLERLKEQGRYPNDQQPQ